MKTILAAATIGAAFLGAVGAADAADAATTCEPGGWCWTSPAPQGNDVKGIWGARADQVWAVGADGTLLRFDGARWAIVPVATRATLGAVWGAAPDDVWAVGGESGRDKPATALHWDGKAWTPTALAAHDEMTSIWGAAPNDIWAGGYGGALVHWDGKAWVAGRSPTREWIRHLSGCASNDVWAVTRGDGVLHWDGRAWSKVPGKALRAADDVACLGAADVMVSTRDGGVLRGGGKRRWVAQHAGGNGTSLLAARAPNDVWRLAGGVIDHWDGRSWSRSAEGMEKEIYALATVGKDEVWASGHAGALLRWDGRAWRRIDTRVGAMNITSVWGTRPDEVWAACEEMQPPQARLLRWDGARWTRVLGIPPVWIKKVWGNAADDVWAVGDIILHWDGKTWARVPAHLWFTLNDVRGLASDDVWAVGDEGVLHWDGKTWTIVKVERKAGLQAVWPSDPDDVWAVGTGDAALRWNGTRWLTVAVPGRTPLAGLWGAGPDDIWAVGRDDTVIHWNKDGRATRVPISRGASVEAASLDAIWGTGPEAIWAAGGRGTIVHWDGASWQGGQTLTQFNLHAIWGDAGGARWAVGDEGTILSRAAAATPPRPAARPRPPRRPSRPVALAPGLQMPAMSDPPPDPAAPPPDRDQSLRVAREWLEMARDRRAGELRRRSVFPLVIEGFDFGGAPREACDAPGRGGGWDEGALRDVRFSHPKGLRASAHDDESFRAALDCFFRDNHLPRYSPQERADWHPGKPPGTVTGSVSIVTASSMSRRMARYRAAIAGLDRSHLLAQAVMTDNDGVTNTVVLALRLVDGAPRVAAVYIDELFEE